MSLQCQHCWQKFKGRRGLASHIAHNPECRGDFFENNTKETNLSSRMDGTISCSSPPTSPFFHESETKKHTSSIRSEASTVAIPIAPLRTVLQNPADVADDNNGHMASWSDDSNQSFSRIHVAATTTNADNCNGCSDLTNHEDNKQFSSFRAVTRILAYCPFTTKLIPRIVIPWACHSFSAEEKVYVELLDLLKNTGAPLGYFSKILKWAAKSNRDGHVFQ